eukprot:scaffold23410_cov66-Phaeocystis_antarctica.AAC.4
MHAKVARLVLGLEQRQPLRLRLPQRFLFRHVRLLGHDRRLATLRTVHTRLLGRSRGVATRAITPRTLHARRRFGRDRGAATLFTAVDAVTQCWHPR